MTQETFERELSRRADDVHGAPFSFDDVRGKAISIRRRRRAALAGGVAAAVALVVLVPTVLAGGGGPKSQGPDPAGPVPGHTSVLHDGTLTLPGGDEVALDVDDEDVSQLAVLGDGRSVVAPFNSRVVQVYGPDGSLAAEYPVEINVITASSTGNAVAWVGKDRGVRVLSSGEAEPVVLPGIPSPGESWSPIDAVLGPDRVIAGDGTTSTYEITPDGATELDLAEPFRVVDVSPDGATWAVAFVPTVENEQYGCAGLYDIASATVVARRCDTPGLTFSPDGQHLLSLLGDNNMAGQGLVLDRDLEVVGQWESTEKGEVISRAAWADAEHLLVTESNWEKNAWTLARVDLSWSDREVVDGPVEGGNPEVMVEFLLSE